MSEVANRRLDGRIAFEAGGHAFAKQSDEEIHYDRPKTPPLPSEESRNQLYNLRILRAQGV
jgi:hypothetical protein